MEDQEERIKELLFGNKISGIEIYQINLEFYEFNDNSFWIFDGGIQFILEHGVFGWGWNFENEIYSYSTEKHIKEFLVPNFVLVDNENIPGISNLIGSLIRNVDIKWEFYQNINEDFEPVGEKYYVPVELKLYLENEIMIQIANIDFELNEETFDMTNPKYSIEGELLFNFNEEIKISEL